MCREGRDERETGNGRIGSVWGAELRKRDREEAERGKTWTREDGVRKVER